MIRWALAAILTPITITVLDKTGQTRNFVMITVSTYLIFFAVALHNSRRR